MQDLVQSALLESNTGRDDRILYNELWFPYFLFLWCTLPCVNKGEWNLFVVQLDRFCFCYIRGWKKDRLNSCMFFMILVKNRFEHFFCRVTLALYYLIIDSWQKWLFRVFSFYYNWYIGCKWEQLLQYICIGHIQVGGMVSSHVFPCWKLSLFMGVSWVETGLIMWVLFFIVWANFTLGILLCLYIWGNKFFWTRKN